MTTQLHIRHLLETGVGSFDLSVYPRHSYKTEALSKSEVFFFSVTCLMKQLAERTPAMAEAAPALAYTGA